GQAPDDARPCNGLTSAPVRKNQKYLPPLRGGQKPLNLVTTSKISTGETEQNLPIQLLPGTKKRRSPGQRPGTTSLLISDDVTKLLSGFLSRMALQGDGPLREPSPRQQGILCAVVNH
ncbi:hypothetical protein F3019_26230, partial [Salmonella enterica]|nr:hypothetical protein [Salmonella enterica]